jgi:L-ascorbate metabolism protein UlaG (beta-lactamase superfamily)
MAELIPAFCKGAALQRQIRDAKKNGDAQSFDVWWLGQSGFVIQWNGKCVLFDPYLSDSLTRKYSSSNKPHIRMSELVIDPSSLDCIDIVTSSHNHTDHLDAETLQPLFNVNPDISFVIPEANRNFVVQRVNCAPEFPTGLTDGQKVTLKEWTFNGVPAAHNELERDESGRCKFMGYVAQFGTFSMYHSGDTLWYEGMEEILAPFHVDVAFLPINGNDPKRGVAGNLNASEAAQLGKKIGARYVIPHHYDMFAFNTADPKDFVREAVKNSQGYVVLKLGQKWTLNAR